jgi:hypothetical protein
MNSQIFKKHFPKELLFQLLDTICMKNEKHYILSNVSYKKGIFDNSIKDFFEICKSYYHLSKRKYIEKTITYNSFVTVIRQICNLNKITYTSQIKYDHSSYDIVYIIYF